MHAVLQKNNTTPVDCHQHLLRPMKRKPPSISQQPLRDLHTSSVNQPLGQIGIEALA